MSNYIYFKNEDDEYSIFASMIESEMESEWEKTYPDITEFVICTEKDSDFPFCYAIENNNKVFKLDQAKDITKDRLRADRKPLFEAQDVLFMQAQESGSSTTDIVAEKQRLRDITKDADSCTTTDQLKALSVEE
jgi:hypothetical protein